ncbi:UDP-glucose 4-epimerase [Microbacterium resistens]|uniref:UDP-glucose 4-epimerase n=1 Tax=Microbacterium resistens TaxID=156977 RepID=A0ABU1S9Q6_9MICO|nr:UDP-glucose 4-epimerase GalE [Microbacterium resistens]MDR6866339.1 UDP-glucose 4-epimerase [Microbacterium resistens]
MKVLITGGAGYIGATIANACADAGITPLIIDDLSAGRRSFGELHTFYQGDIADGDLLRRIVAEHPDLHCVVHCAARIVVEESVQDPLGYYDANVAKSIEMLHHLTAAGVRRFVFSSSAAIYRGDDGGGIDESGEIAPTNPYGAGKAMVERVLEDAATAGILRAISLRYFNPIGADPTLRTGQQKRNPAHALGRIMRAHADGEAFTITGTDWPTRDGSGLRDYIHVQDLAEAHVAAVLRFDEATAEQPAIAINIGTGDGVTVRELVAAYERVTGERLLTVEAPRRPGDQAGGHANVEKAGSLLGWSSRLTVDEGIRDAIAWAVRLDATPPGSARG